MVNFQSVIALSPESRSSPCVKQVDQHNLILEDTTPSAATTANFPAEAVLSTTFDLGDAVIQPLVEDCILNGSTSCLLLFAPEDDKNLPSSAFASLSSMLSSIPRRIREVENQIKKAMGIPVEDDEGTSSSCQVKIVAKGGGDHDGLPQDVYSNSNNNNLRGGVATTFFNHVTPLPRDEGWSLWLQSQWLAEHQDILRAQQQDYNHHRRLTEPQPKLNTVIIETETENFSPDQTQQHQRGKLVTVVVPIPSDEFMAVMLAIQSSTNASVLSSLSKAHSSSSSSASRSSSLSSSFPPPITKPMSTFLLDYLRHVFASPNCSNCLLLSVPDLQGGNIIDSSNNNNNVIPRLSYETRLLMFGISSHHGNHGVEILSSIPVANNNSSIQQQQQQELLASSSPLPQNPVFSDSQPPIYRSTAIFGNNNKEESNNNTTASGLFSLKRLGASTSAERNNEDRMKYFPPSSSSHHQEEDVRHQSPTKTIKIGLREYPNLFSNPPTEQEGLTTSNQRHQHQHLDPTIVSPSSQGGDSSSSDDDDDDEDDGNNMNNDALLLANSHTMPPSSNDNNNNINRRSTSSSSDSQHHQKMYINNSENTTTALPSPTSPQNQNRADNLYYFNHNNNNSSTTNNIQQQQQQNADNNKQSFNTTTSNNVAISRGLELLNRRRQEKMMKSSTTTSSSSVDEEKRVLSSSLMNQNVTNLEHIESFVNNNNDSSSSPTVAHHQNNNNNLNQYHHQHQHHRHESEEEFHQRIARFAALEAELKTVRSERDDDVDVDDDID